MLGSSVDAPTSSKSSMDVQGEEDMDIVIESEATIGPDTSEVAVVQPPHTSHAKSQFSLKQLSALLESQLAKEVISRSNYVEVSTMKSTAIFDEASKVIAA